jgi:hypothetical protein
MGQCQKIELATETRKEEFFEYVEEEDEAGNIL